MDGLKGAVLVYLHQEQEQRSSRTNILNNITPKELAICEKKYSNREQISHIYYKRIMVKFSIRHGSRQ